MRGIDGFARSLRSLPSVRLRATWIGGAAGLLSLVVVPDANATDYYVATTGSDSATGTQSQPFRSIRRAITAAQAGDTVVIRGGTYSGWENQINPTRSGSASAWITFRAFDGELPIVEPPSGIQGGSGFEPLDVAVQYIRVEGLAARNWPSSGFSNGWNHPSSNIEVRYCIAEGNGINGITFYKSSNVRFEYNIVAHNGNRAPSWSSGVNLFAATGTYQNNLVRGNVSFENIDVCGNTTQHTCDAARSTDGNGFILDEASTGALFENNIGFRNGGSCIRLTNSSGARLINNSCYHNGLDSGYDFSFDEIFFSDLTSRNNVVVRNNIAAAGSGKDAINATSGSGSTFQNNLWVNDNGATPFFMNPAGPNPDFRLTASATQVIDQGNSTGIGPTDVGFDPRCIRQQGGQAVTWWQYAPDYAYIASIGGIKNCFHPVARPQGAAPDLGAYEYSTTAGCSSAAECDDGEPCTTDTCGGTGQCNHVANANCCAAPADCDDGNACTIDECDVSTQTCSSTAVSRCCTSNADCSSPSACITMTCDTGARLCVSESVSGCCATAADCNDGDGCTMDACDAASGTCSNVPTANCCQLDGDCADQDPCTADACDATTRTCVHEPTACGSSGTNGGSGSGGSASVSAADPAGCACRTVRQRPQRSYWLAVFGLTSLLAWRRRRASQR